MMHPYLIEMEKELNRELNDQERAIGLTAAYLEERNRLLMAAKFALSVLESNHPVEASEFLAIEELRKAIAATHPPIG